jgi:hypothetical protein
MPNPTTFPMMKPSRCFICFSRNVLGRVFKPDTFGLVCADE